MRDSLITLGVLFSLVVATTAVSHDRRDIVATIIDSPVRHFEHVHIAQSHVLRRSINIGEEDDARYTSGFTFPVNAFNESWELKMKPAIHLFAPDAKWGTGEPLTHHGYYTGKVGNDPNSFAHAHVSKDGVVTATFMDGSKNNRFYIRPTPTELKGPESSSMVIFKSSDIVESAGLKYKGKVVGPKNEDDNRDRRLVASSYDASRSVCTMAIYLDESYVTQFGIGNSINVAIERFSQMQVIFEGTTFTSPVSTTLKQSIKFLDYGGSSSDTEENVESLLTGVTTANRYLMQFSKQDWNDFCLSHAFTYRDFDSTLGLAWTAFPDSEGFNGGICQARYNDPSEGAQVSFNTAFHTQNSGGNTQSGDQSTLVMSHEVGHNYGSQHDENVVPDGGVFLMYPYANAGTEENNKKFSAKSIGEISEVVGDRGGCFVEAAFPECGNAITEANVSYIEKCDGGPLGTSCCKAVTSGVDCTDDSAFKDGAECTPESPIVGECCEGCTFKADGSSCGTETSCTLAGTCQNDTHTCSSGVPKSDGLSCEPGIILPDNGRGSSVCNAGQCNTSLCTVAGLTACTGGITGSGACAITCEDPADNNACKAMTDITFITDPAEYRTTNGGPLVTLTSGNVPKKPSGSFCEFEAGKLSSGICNADQECELADGEESALDELKKQFSKFQRLFSDWANEETAGLKNYIWLIIGGVLVLMLCCLGCYVANRPAIDQYRKKEKGSSGDGGNVPARNNTTAF